MDANQKAEHEILTNPVTIMKWEMSCSGCGHIDLNRAPLDRAMTCWLDLVRFVIRVYSRSFAVKVYRFGKKLFAK